MKTYNDEQYVDYDEASKMLLMTTDSVRNLVGKGTLTAYTISYGRKKYLKVSEIKTLARYARVQSSLNAHSQHENVTDNNERPKTDIMRTIKARQQKQIPAIPEQVKFKQLPPLDYELMSINQTETANKKIHELKEIQKSLPVDGIPIPFPIQSHSLIALDHASKMYSQLSESYKEIAQPLIQTVRDTDSEAFINAMGAFMQSVIVGLYSLPNDRPIFSIPPIELLHMILQHVDLPDEFKTKLVSFAVKEGEKIVQHLEQMTTEEKQ